MPPEERLTKLRTLEEWLDYQLRTTRARIATLEAEVERERRQRERAWREQRWKLQPQRSAEDTPAILHRGGCSLYPNPTGYIDRHEAQLALADPDLPLECCAICRPETGLQE
jgi:hypothetical protein